MQVTETTADGLKHEFKVVVPATHIEEKVNSRLVELGRTARIPGFRPGKVPMPMLRKKYGASIMGEVLEHAVSDGMRNAVAERKLRPAMQPKVEITSFKEGGDLEFTVALEALPEIKFADFAAIEIEALKPVVADDEVEKGLARLAERQDRSEPVTGKRKSKKGDVAVIDFVGRVGGEAFDGGSAEGFHLKLGSDTFIPGFEEQLIGAKAGDKVTVKVTFPADYGNEALAGKEAEFEVDVKELREPAPAAVDDQLAKDLGMEGVDALRKAVREQIEREYAAAARMQTKRRLLDALAATHEFPVPEGMIDLEFDAIWKQLEQDRQKGQLDDEDKAKGEDELKSDYRGIAERRVRLGLLLSEVGRTNNITVTQEDLNRGLMQEASRFPGQEHLVISYYHKNPEALDSLRAPIFEEKVVDFILELVKVKEKPVTPEELKAESAEQPAQPKKKAPAKAAGAKAKKKAAEAE